MHVADGDLHPQLRRTGRLVRRMMPAFTERTLRLAAAATVFADRLRFWPGASPRPRREFLARPDGTRLAVSVFDPKGGALPGAPVVLWIHGGGFALGAPWQDCGFIDRFVALGCTVVAPSYRLSVRAPYPAALDDCFQALTWASCTFCAPGAPGEGPARPLTVGGDSAGGNLCAAVCLRVRDEDGVPVAFHMPLYPMLDDRMETPSARDNDAPVWNTASNRVAWRFYLGELCGTDEVPAYAAPARAEDLSGMPPCCTYVGTVEPFHDETVAYVERLRTAGVPVDLLELPGCFHGFDMLCPSSDPAREAGSFLERSFCRALGWEGRAAFGHR